MLSVEHITFAYEPHRPPAVEDCTAQARGGRITAIIGPNSAGKSTLLRLMAGVLAPARGGVSLDGENLSAMPARQRASRLAYVPQRPRVDAPFTVREVVQLGRFALPHSTTAISEALQRCELARDADRLFNALSVGQQQRASLARALAQVHGCAAGAVLLDEPTAALDPRHVQQTGRILRDLADAGRTVVVILHDLVLARRLSDDLWVMHEGRIVATGPTAEVLEPALLERVYGVGFEAAHDVLLPAVKSADER